MKVIEVNKNEAGQRLDKLLAKYLNEAPKSFFYKMLRKKNITLNGKKASGAEKLEQGDRVILFLSDETIEKFSHITVQKTDGSKLLILYEDENILILNKPAGMLSQKAKKTDESMVEQVIAYTLESGRFTKEEMRLFQPGICNRLDRNTSGILVAGVSLIGLQTMAKLFRERLIHKYYLCLIDGVLKEKKRISGFLTKDSKTNRVVISRKPLSEDSQPIETEYTPLADNGSMTLLKVWLITGRSHQIRAHLASIGHPIAGDSKYGDADVNRLFKKKYRLGSQLLHSSELHMPKLTGALENVSEKSFYAPLPERFLHIIQQENIPWKDGM